MSPHGRPKGSYRSAQHEGAPVNAKAVVFIGPSLALPQARALCADLPDGAIAWRPPARMGDVYRAALQAPDAILIIDGYFEQVPSVWHKEVLFALSRGIRVLGASSMGALRAAELHQFGMQGVGRVFAAYASGAITDDDEVAIVHGQGGGRFALASDAMVNLRFALDDARDAGLVDAALHGQLVALAKARFYPQRSWPTLWQDATAAGIPADALADLRAHIERTQPNQKRDDAIEVLHVLSDSLCMPAPPRAAPLFVFEHTLYWETVETYFRDAAAADASEGSAGAATAERLRNHVRLFDAQRDRTLERALLLSLVTQEARRLRGGQHGSPADDAVALRRFRRRRGLLGSEALAAWMAQQHVDADGCLQLARAEQLLREIAMRHVAQVDAWLEPVLKLEGRWHASVQEVRRKWRSLHAQGITSAGDDDVGDRGAVLDWYQARWGRLDDDLQAHWGERGFSSMRHFLDELYAEYVAQACADTPAAA